MPRTSARASALPITSPMKLWTRRRSSALHTNVQGIAETVAWGAEQARRYGEERPALNASARRAAGTLSHFKRAERGTSAIEGVRDHVPGVLSEPRSTFSPPASSSRSSIHHEGFGPRTDPAIRSRFTGFAHVSATVRVYLYTFARP